MADSRISSSRKVSARAGDSTRVSMTKKKKKKSKAAKAKAAPQTPASTSAATPATLATPTPDGTKTS